MSVGSGVNVTTAPAPAMLTPNDNSSNNVHVPSLSSSSSSISDSEHDRKSRAKRPRLARREPSASILVPRNHPEIEIEEEEFPPDDARAMSPRSKSRRRGETSQRCSRNSSATSRDLAIDVEGPGGTHR
ncbi:hypothetical protein I7I51_06853 [Histoplasma capsulatum]|uniref:Uncharacterized protein n=1 Tax=Ajellomyces capsulatus TaxID=5037 RepID=A0A8A1MN07_AJECA|nr:hypothetical protein I7I51_06853 [Histoplasma capsulatum]